MPSEESAKHLKEEGVELAKVKSASDKAWAVLGAQAAQQMKPLFAQPLDITALQQAGAIAETVHGIEVKQKTTVNAIHSEFLLKEERRGRSRRSAAGPGRTRGSALGGP